MLQINFIRENAEIVKAGLAKKHFKNINVVDELLKLDEEKRKAQVETENNAAESNQLAKKIGTKQSNIARMEAGQQNFSVDILEKIAGALGSSLSITFSR